MNWKEKLLVYSITTPIIFAALTCYGLVSSLIIVGKLFICKLEISIISYFFNCDQMVVNIESNSWLVELSIYLGKLFFVITIPVAILGYGALLFLASVKEPNYFKNLDFYKGIILVVSDAIYIMFLNNIFI